jgi:hypothetical protein
LRRAAGEDIDKRKVAGLIAVSPDWCWRRFVLLADDPLFDWAMDELAKHVRDNDGAPKCVLARAKTTTHAEDRQGATRTHAY